jgi:hypothetical protein
MPREFRPIVDSDFGPPGNPRPSPAALELLNRVRREQHERIEAKMEAIAGEWAACLEALGLGAVSGRLRRRRKAGDRTGSGTQHARCPTADTHG